MRPLLSPYEFPPNRVDSSYAPCPIDPAFGDTVRLDTHTPYQCSLGRFLAQANDTTPNQRPHASHRRANKHTEEERKHNLQQ